MRKELQNIAGVRQRFTAQFVRFGTKPSYKGAPTITLLFGNVRDKRQKQYTDHIWFTNNLGFKKLNLQPGEQISFDARVKKYTKGYRGRREDVEAPISTDYKLSHPNNIVKHLVGKQNQLF